MKPPPRTHYRPAPPRMRLVPIISGLLLSLAMLLLYVVCPG